MQQMVGQNWLSVAAFNFTHAAGWLAGWLVLQTLEAGRIIFCCRVLADLIYGGTRFRVFFSPPALSLSLSNLLMVVNPAKIDADHCCSWMPCLFTCSCYGSY